MKLNTRTRSGAFLYNGIYENIFFQGARLVKQPNQRHTGQRFQKVILMMYNVSFLTGDSSDAEFSGSPVHS